MSGTHQFKPDGPVSPLDGSSNSAIEHVWTDAEVAVFSRERIEVGSKSFAGAARLFSSDVRDSAYKLYAWCRHCDDEIDGQILGHNTAEAANSATRARLHRLTQLTISAIKGQASDPIFLALQQVVQSHAIPAHLPLELIEGMAMDVHQVRYQTLDDTLRYSYHVAGCVGVMMTMIMGARDRPTLDRACDLGLAFQLTNIARDVYADAAIGRCYLPADWLDAVALTPDTVADPANRARVHTVTLRLLDEADRYYASAYHGLPQLPLRSSIAIASARRIYRDIGHVVREAGVEGSHKRARVGSLRKLSGVALASVDVLTAKTWGRLRTPPTRAGLWTMPPD
jgi:15-cis-phytoene synthase